MENNELFKGLKNLHAQSDRRGLVVREVFEDAYNYMKSWTLMRQVINKINEIDFNISEDRHLLCVTNMLLHGIEGRARLLIFFTKGAPTKEIWF